MPVGLYTKFKCRGFTQNEGNPASQNMASIFALLTSGCPTPLDQYGAQVLDFLESAYLNLEPS